MEGKEREQILNWFYTDICDEDERLLTSKHGSIEFLTTTKYVEKYLPSDAKADTKILEIGAGTGRYSLYYADLGYDVTAIEYVEGNLNILRSKIKTEMKIRAEQGDAVDLSRFEDNTFDMTLVLGPLYHLYEREDQERAISEAVRVTKKGGVVAFAYLASDSIMIDWALRDHHLIDGMGKDFDGNFKIINYPQGVFAAFYIQEFKDLVGQFPVKMEHNIATDGMARHMMEQIDGLTDEEFDAWLKYHFSTCEREELQGYSNHLLYMGRKL
ncbi:MAG: methyltransferase domain-containing protein [Lachnospiraceae bacterium]|nr:methyltransferase domain-containing protein [Lachnospiraceae bacterium]